MSCASVDEHAVIVHLKLSTSDFGSEREREALYALEDAVASAIVRAQAGEHDGHEIGGGEFVIYCYGPNADVLLAAIDSTLRASPLSKGASVVVRYGKPGTRQKVLRL